MNYRHILGDFSIALLAQATSLLLGFVTSLIIPKVLNVTEYGYWQLFVFYAGYVGFFHFGLNDGVYLIHGGETQKNIDKRSIGSQFSFSIAMESLMSIALIVVALFGPFEAERTFIILATAIFLLINNAALFLGYIFQAMNETKIFSYSTAINNLTLLIALIFLSILGIHDFRIYISFYVSAKTLSLLYCIIKGRELVYVKKYPLKKTAKLAFSSVRVGSKLLIANLASMLIIGFLQFFVDFHWGVEVFGKLSFALSLVSLFQIFAAQASMVLFPALRQTNAKEITSFFSIASLALGIILPAAFVLYLPISVTLSLWLPQYEESFRLFGLLLPICLFESRMDLIGVTYLKVLRKEKTLLIINCVASLLSMGSVVTGILIFDSIELAIILMVFIIACRSLFTEHFIRKTICAPTDNMALFTTIFSILFIIGHLLLPSIITFSLAIIGYGLYVVTQRKKITIIKTLFKETTA